MTRQRRPKVHARTVALESSILRNETTRTPRSDASRPGEGQEDREVEGSVAGPALCRFLFAEKRARSQALSEYNSRLDRTIALYLSAVYAALGLHVSGRLDLTPIRGDTRFAPLAFLFIFLNLCIILYGISLSAWSISLAKFIHHHVDPKLRGTRGPSSQVGVWDDWDHDVKGVAVQTRTVVMILWILLVLVCSLLSLSVVNVRGYYEQHTFVAVLMGAVLIALLTYIFYEGVLEWYYVRQFREIEPRRPKRLLLLFQAAMVATIVSWVGGALAISTTPAIVGNATTIVNTPLIQEFIARKEQVLNLEMRVFWLLLALQAVFILSFLNHSIRHWQTGSALAFFTLFLVLLATTGKMGLASGYLRQLEAYLELQGYPGLLWERRALDAIIFVGGNAFTLPGGLTAVFVLVEAAILARRAISEHVNSSAVVTILTIGVLILLVVLTLKVQTVDFGRPLPKVFEQGG